MIVFRVSYEDKNLYTKNKWFLRLNKAVGFYYMKIYQGALPCIFHYDTSSKITHNLSDLVEADVNLQINVREDLLWK